MGISVSLRKISKNCEQ